MGLHSAAARGPMFPSVRVTMCAIVLLIASLGIVMYHQVVFQVGHLVDEAVVVDGAVVAAHADVGDAVAADLLEGAAHGHGGDPVRDNQQAFTVVLLSYRSPMSLRNTLVSLCQAGVHKHPDFHEVLVYFQVFETRKDTQLVEDVLRPEGPCGGSPSVRYRVVGAPENLPVATATLRAVRSVATTFVLYLECDRPILSPPSSTADDGAGNGFGLWSHHALEVSRQITAALTFLEHRGADVFRLQLYSAAVWRRASLPVETYGTTPFTHCAHVTKYHSNSSTAIVGEMPPLTGSGQAIENDGVGGSGSPVQAGICARKALAKKLYGNVFYTAYCKHWNKLRKTSSTSTTEGGLTPQQDMCDSFCFFQWATSLLGRTSDVFARQSHQTSGDASGVGVYADVSAIRRMLNASVALYASDKERVPVLCLDSEWCNWSNQPSMYRKAWYLAQIGGPCEGTNEGRSYCIGSPGRQSAVRQELFFVKRREHWAKKHHKICLSSGLFIHHEVDNKA